MRSWVMLVLCGAVLACATGPSLREAKREVAENHPEQALPKLEELRKSHPKSSDVALELGVAYFKMARKALDEGNDAAYVAYLGKAQDNVLIAAELDPRSSQPHTWMGIIAAYQSDLDRTLTSLKNARRLAPRHPVHYTNLAETYIYMGELSMARRYLRKARDLGAPPIYIEINEMLAAWRSGDYVEARDLFATAYQLNPEIVQEWNEAPVSQPISSFEDFTRFCCSHLACGPYMANACAEMKHEVRQRSVSSETLRQELVLEMERRRRLRAIYEGRKDLEIVVEEPEPAAR